jgi:hypothetical protein
MPGDVIGAAWREYRLRVIPVHASAVQAQESRRAFYAGAQALLTGILRGLDPGDDPTQADLARMDAIAQELEQFARDVLAGRA